MMAEKTNMITVKRETNESKIVLKLGRGARDADFKKKINTPLQFFNHMLETISWRGCVNLEVDVDMPDFKLTHVICEDVGLSLGEAYRELFMRELEGGINGSGSAVACIDEAMCRAVVSFEDRALFVAGDALRERGELVEDMQQADLLTFIDGFAQGARATAHLDLLRGDNPHHVWESAFRAFAEALRAAFEPCPWRAGTTPGVKGKVSLKKD
ncbi:MAG TPA: hypothetical protein PKH33_03300 [bacterium]|nr:hypothetical protein [bacterium]